MPSPVLLEFARVLTQGGAVTFPVTHPEMNPEGYGLALEASMNSP